MLVSSLAPGLLDEFDDEWLSHEFRLEKPSGGIRAHVHRERHPRAGHVDAESLKRAGRNGHGLRSTHLDRKSTRLNSSHSQISYAVFCLKKKKKTNVYRYERQNP